MILNEVEGGDENRLFRVDLHPSITVITGLAAAQRRELGAAISAAMHGYDVGLKLNVNIFGQEGRLSPQVVAALGFAGLDVDNVMDGGELPGARVEPESVAENIHQTLRRLRSGDLAQGRADVVAEAAATSVPDESPPESIDHAPPVVDVRSLPAVTAKIEAAERLRDAVVEASEAVRRSKIDVEKARSHAESLEASVEAAAMDGDSSSDEDGVELPPKPDILPPALPDFAWVDPYRELIDDEEAALAAQREALAGLEAEVAQERSIADSAIEQALAEASRASARAEQQVADAEARLQRAQAHLIEAQEQLAALTEVAAASQVQVQQLEVAASVDVPSPTEVATALSEAQREPAPQEESGPTPGQLADRWTELSKRLEELRLEPKPPAWLIAQVRDEYEESTARVTALRFQRDAGIDVRDVLVRAEDRLRQASEAWEEMKSGPALEYERADAEAARLYAQSVEMLGFQPGRKFLGEALRAEQEKLDEASNHPEKRLREALAAVGVQATAGEAVTVAEHWLNVNAAAATAAEEARRAHEEANSQLVQAEAAVDHHRQTVLADADHSVAQIESEIIQARTEIRDAAMRIRAMTERPEEFKAQALERITKLDEKIEEFQGAIAAAETGLQELRASQAGERQTAERQHQKIADAALAEHQKESAAALLEWEERNASLIRLAEERRRERLEAQAVLRRQAEERLAAAIAEANVAVTAALVGADEAQVVHGAAVDRAEAAEAAIEETVESEKRRLDAEAAADRQRNEEAAAAAAREKEREEAERQAAAEAEAAESQPWWARPPVKQEAAAVDLSKVDRGDLDFYVLSKGASLRAVGRSESMPLIIDAAFDELPPLVAQAAFDALTKISAAVQVIYLSGNEAGERWVARQSERVGRQSRVVFS